MPPKRNDDGSANFSRIGRANKNRGRNFERKVADLLEWTRVPYSGAIKDWGGGDVVDGFYKKRGFWSAECKTQQPGPRGSISILQKWIQQMGNGAIQGRRSLIITRNVGSIKIYAVLPVASVEIIIDSLMPSEYDAMLIGKDPLYAAGLGMGFVIPPSYLEAAHDYHRIISFNVESKKLDTTHGWAIMSLDTFKSLIDKHHLMEYEDEDAGDGE